MRAMMESRAISLGKAWLSVGIDATASALQVDTVISVGKAFSESIKIVKGGFDEQSLAHVRSASSKHSLSRSDALLEDFKKIFNPKLRSYANTPGIIFIDDAQFSAHDPALPSFLERLLKLASKEKWPVLILATHWRREFSSWSASSAHESQNSLPKIIQRVGGVGADLSVREIDLSGVADLGPALNQKFPGLTHYQQLQILERVGGNPRFLEQIVALLEETEDYFVDIDTTQALTAEGLEEILKATPDIFTTVMKRLRAAPEEVQQALGLASVQGMQFLSQIVAEMGKELVGCHLSDHLAIAENPYSMVLSSSSASRIGAFSERLLQEVSTKRRRSLRSLGGEQRICDALRERLCVLLDHPNPEQVYSEDELLVAYRLAIIEFDESKGKPDKQRFEDAIARLVALEHRRGSNEAATAFQKIMYKIPNVPASQEFERCWLAAISHLTANAGDEDLTWIKSDLSPPLMEHLSFRIKNQIYLVRIIDIDGKVQTQGTTAGLINHANEWNGVPCLMTMQFKNGEWDTVAPGWGLLHAQNNMPINPMEIASDEPVEMTDWELYDFAVSIVRKYIEETLGRSVANYCNNPLISPSLFFEGEQGLEWVVVRVSRDTEGGQRPEDGMATLAMLKNHGYPYGHFASLGITSAYGPTQPLVRGEGMVLHFSGLETFLNGQPMVISEKTGWQKAHSFPAND